MTNKRRRYDQNSAIAAGVDHLLRQQRRLDTGNLGFGSGVPPGLKPFKGPIERDFLITAFDSRPELIKLADFRCSFADDDIEWNLALAAAVAVHDGEGAVVVVASGSYIMADGATITVPRGVSLLGPPTAHFGGGGGTYALNIVENGDLSFVVNGYMDWITSMSGTGG